MLWNHPPPSTIHPTPPGATPTPEAVTLRPPADSTTVLPVNVTVTWNDRSRPGLFTDV